MIKNNIFIRYLISYFPLETLIQLSLVNSDLCRKLKINFPKIKNRYTKIENVFSWNSDYYDLLFIGFCTKYRRIKILKYLYQNHNDFLARYGIYIFYKAFNISLDIIEFIGKRIDVSRCNIFKINNLKFLKFAIEHNIRIDPLIIYNYISKNNYECFDYFLENSLFPNEEPELYCLIMEIIESGNLDFFACLHKHNYLFWNEDFVYYCVIFSRLNFLKYAFENNYPMYKTLILQKINPSIFLSKKQTECLNYIRDL